MRLHVPESPLRRHHCGSEKKGKVFHEGGGLVRIKYEQVKQSGDDLVKGRESFKAIESLVSYILNHHVFRRRLPGDKKPFVTMPQVNLHPGGCRKQRPAFG